MANQYTLDNDFAAIAEPQGTLYNVGDSAIELADADTTPKGQGILLMTGERRTFNGTLYARSMDTAATLNVSDFTEAAGGGDDAADVRRPSTAYTVGALVDGAGLASGLVLRCITAGTTSSAALDCSGYELGDTITDGTVTWTVEQYVITTDGGTTVLPATTDSVDLGSASKAWRKLYVQSIDSPRFRSPSASYNVGDFCFLSIVEPVKLVCVKAGTSGTGALSLSSTAEGAITTDGTVVWIVDSLADGIYTAEHQNGIARGGADLTAYWDSGHMSANIQAGKFVGMHVGDFIVKTVSTAAKTYTNKSGTSVTIAAATYTDVKWLLAGFDVHLHCGATETTAHHVIMLPSSTLMRNVAMNPTISTEGGYTGSDMWTQIIPMWATAIQNAFGSAHVLTHYDYLSKSISATAQSAAGGGFVGASNNWENKAIICNLPNEPMVYGGPVFGSSGYDVGTFPRILPLYALKANHLDDRSWFWLRAVASASGFCNARGDGLATYVSASGSNSDGGLRPYFLLR